MKITCDEAQTVLGWFQDRTGEDKAGFTRRSERNWQLSLEIDKHIKTHEFNNLEPVEFTQLGKLSRADPGRSLPKTDHGTKGHVGAWNY